MQTDNSTFATDGRPSVSAHPVLGTILLYAGVLLVGLALVDWAVGGLPFWMPRSWHSSRVIWYFLAIVCLIAGPVLLKTRPASSWLDWKPGTPGVRFRGITLYTREGCHLCDQAKDEMLRYRAYLPAIEEVDIDTDPELSRRFSDCLPAVEIDGKLRFRGRVNEFALRRLIEGTKPLP